MAHKDYEERFIELPWDVVDTCNGFSLDIGGSVMKLLYIDKDEWQKPSERKPDTKCRVHLKHFSHSELDDNTAITFIKKHAHINRKAQEKPTIYGTGFNVSMNGQTLNDKLDVSMECAFESDSFIRGFVYVIKNLPFQHIVDLSFREQDKKAMVAQLKEYSESVTSFTESVTNTQKQKFDVEKWLDSHINFNPEKPMTTDHNIFPCVLLMCGSAFGAFEVHHDRTHYLPDTTKRGGKLWLGMGSLLTNSKSFQELMDLAGKGCIEALNYTSKDIASGHQSEIQEPWTIFDFAKAESKSLGDFKREDLAASFLNVMVSEVANLGMRMARLLNLRHVFCSGSFVNHPLVVRQLRREWLMQSIEAAVFDQTMAEPIHLHVLKHGSHMGALGALLTEYEKIENNF